MQSNTSPFRVGNTAHAKSPASAKYGKKIIKINEDHMKLLFREKPGINLKPVKLNYEFFHQYGFTKLEDVPGKWEAIFTKGNLYIYYRKRDEFCFKTAQGAFIRIKYEHDLQNLYLILNGKEL